MPRTRFLVALLLLLARRNPAAAQELRIRFLNVGQGDAALITTPEGRRVLIDAGPGTHAVADSLVAWHIDTLDFAVASHAHADHIGGMAEVLNRVVVRYYLDNGMRHTTATYGRTMRAVTARGPIYLKAEARTVTVGSVRLRVVPPPPGARGQNSASVGILLEFGEFRALFTGDSELGELGYWLAHDSIPRVQVLKVAHHGAGNGSSIPWTRAMQPMLAVISVGRNNYGHPSAGVVEMWRSLHAKVVRTDEHGAVDVVADSSGAFRLTTRLGSWPYDSLALVPR